jgi:hypothetical protein
MIANLNTIWYYLWTTNENTNYFKIDINPMYKIKNLVNIHMEDDDEKMLEKQCMLEKIKWWLLEPK